MDIATSERVSSNHVHFAPSTRPWIAVKRDDLAMKQAHAGPAASPRVV